MDMGHTNMQMGQYTKDNSSWERRMGKESTKRKMEQFLMEHGNMEKDMEKGNYYTLVLITKFIGSGETVTQFLIDNDFFTIINELNS